jgi:hypothetical protein
MDLTSKVSHEIEIEHVDERGQPEHFVLRRGSFSYTVLPGLGCLTSGDVEAVRECAAPDERNNGTTARIVLIHDQIAARNAGQTDKGGWITRFVVVASSSDALAVGTYHNHVFYGSSRPLEIPNDSTPSFTGVFEDVTEEFLSAATPEQLSAREAIGTVWQRACVDAEPGRSWENSYGDGIVFAGTVAPDLAAFNPRERLGLLIEAGFRDIVEFEATSWRAHAQTHDEAQALLSGDTVELAKPHFETVSCFRLHSDDLVLREVYDEMADDAAKAFRKIEAPRNLREALRSSAPAMSMAG